MKAERLLAHRYLSTGRSRSVLTLVAVMLAAALVSGSGIIMQSVRQQMIRSAVRTHGDYHLLLSELSPSQAALIIRQSEVEAWGFVVREEITSSRQSQPLELNILGGETASMFGIRRSLVKGTFPAGRGEVLIGARFADLLQLSNPVGSSIRISGTGGRSSLRVSGVYEERVYRSDAPAETVYGSAELGDIPSESRVSLYLRIHQLGEIRKVVEKVSDRTGIELTNCRYNESLLNMYGRGLDENVNAALRRFTLVIVLTVLIATAALVYNSFAVSMTVRIRQFGIMRCIGAAPAQIRRVVLHEALLLAAAGIPVGLLMGIGGINLLFRVADRLSDNVVFEEIEPVISVWLLAFAVVTVLGTLVLSALLPAFRASAVPPISAVRDPSALTPTVARKGSMVSKMQAAQVSLVLAGRNLMSDRRRFTGTLASIIISVILFVTFGGLLRLSREANLVTKADLPGITLTREAGIEESVFETLAAHPAVTDLYPYRVLQEPVFGDYNRVEDGIDLVVSRGIFEQLNSSGGGFQTLLIKPASTDSMESLHALLDTICGQGRGYNYLNAQAVADGLDHDYRVVSIFFYGFMTMIILIGCLNVVNTVNANLLLRRREFGLLLAVGMEQYRVIRIIVWEMALIAVAGALSGALAGSGIWYLLVRIAGEVRGTVFFLPLFQILTSLIVVPLLAAAVAWVRTGGLRREAVVDLLQET